MPARSEFVDHVLELLGPFGRIEARRMFGGHGIYCDGVFIAILAEDALFLKTDAESRATFEHAGCAPFTYLRNGRAATLNFHRAPEDALESPHQMRPWARGAIAAALRARATKAKKKTGRSRRPVSVKKRES